MTAVVCVVVRAVVHCSVSLVHGSVCLALSLSLSLSLRISLSLSLSLYISLSMYLSTLYPYLSLLSLPISLSLFFSGRRQQ